MTLQRIADAVLRYWPVIAGVGATLGALWMRSDLMRLAYTAIVDRAQLASDTAELRKRFSKEVERADFWESRCDDLEKQFRSGLQEIMRIRRALRAYKQIIHDLLVDRETLREWGLSLAQQMTRDGLSMPAPMPAMTTGDLNILDPTRDKVEFD